MPIMEYIFDYAAMFNFGIFQVKCLWLGGFMGIIKVRDDIATNCLENILKFSQVASCIFRTFLS